MDIKQFDRKVCQALSDEVTQALEPLAKKYGLTLEPANGRFSSSEWTKKFTFKIGDSEVQKKAAEKTFRELAFLYNLEPDDFGKTVMFNRKPYKVVGIRTKASKRNIYIERFDGKIFVTSADEISRQLRRNDKSIILTNKDLGTNNLSDPEGE